MIPPLIVREALELGIEVIAITDHNATENILAVQKAAKGTGLFVLPGIELQTREEVHSLCLFDTLEQTAAFQSFVDRHLPSIQNEPDFFGEQYVVDETGDFIRNEDRMLLISTDISLQEAWKQVLNLGGLLIPAHVNRKAFGLLEVLGFVPDDIEIEALEISRHLTLQKAPVLFPQIRGYPLIQNGDVHSLDGFLGNSYFTLASPSIEEIRLAIHHDAGRSLTLSA